MRQQTLPSVVLLLIASSSVGGCSFAGAPSFELFGAFFPAWMFCALIGIFGAAGMRLVLTFPALQDPVPFQLAVCTAAGVIAGVGSWMLLFA